jgi:outer membrane protein TolC
LPNRCIAKPRKRIKDEELCYRTDSTPAFAFDFAALSEKSRMRRSLKVFAFVVLSLIFTIFSARRLEAQSTSAPPTSPSISLPGSQSPYLGSAPEGTAIPQVLQIDFKDAIDRGLRNNLGLLLASDQTLASRGERWHQLAELLPNVGIRGQEDVQTLSLTALGLKGNVLHAPVPRVIGPFNYFDLRANLTQSIFNFRSLENARAATASLKAAQFSLKDAREVVVLAVGNAYLQEIAAAARVDTAEAQVRTAQALSDKADDQLKAGVIPAVDALRAKVELQNRQQQLIVARNDLAKSTLSVARVIGLPPGQQFVLTEKAPYQALTPQPIDTYLQRAYAQRADYQSAVAQVQSAELSRKAATAGHYPTLDMNANFGAIGVNPSQSNGTWQVDGGINIPIFAGNRVHGDVLEADSQLRQARSKLGDLRGQIDYQVRTALLDLNAAAEQVEVARSSVDLAEQTLTQSQDRFSAGVTDNLEVVQAQQSVADAHESYIQSLYAHNLAKVELAYSIGDAEQGVKRYLKGNQ